MKKLGFVTLVTLILFACTEKDESNETAYLIVNKLSDTLYDVKGYVLADSLNKNDLVNIDSSKIKFEEFGNIAPGAKSKSLKHDGKNVYLSFTLLKDKYLTLRPYALKASEENILEVSSSTLILLSQN